MGKPRQTLDWDLIQVRAIMFVNRWKKSGKTNEKSYGHGFVMGFLNVFGIDWLNTSGEMEHRMFDGYSDYIWFGKIIIEMKSKGADPGFRQAEAQIRRYTQNLALDQQPILWMACDFENIRLWNRKADKVYDFTTSKLNKYRKHFAPIVEHGTDTVIRHDKESVNRLAAEKMARLHDELKKHGYSGQDLEIYLARLLFCLFANDTDIFEQDAFQTYIENSNESGADLDARLTQLFQDLNEPIEERIPNSYFTDQIDTTHFRYINGGLFEKSIRRARFDKKTRLELLECLDFDWSQIRPAIFGSMFQGVMDSGQRREIGAHYTSEENILKLINPLFMDELRREFDSVKKKTSYQALARFHDKIADLKFLDPACGCGNFLIVAYRELRRLELDIVRAKRAMLGGEAKTQKGVTKHTKGVEHSLLDINTELRVAVEQFHGIEILPWPCQLARTGMWLMDHLMNMEATDELGQSYLRLPLTEGATIAHGNALRIDWESVVPKEELSFIMGNPPFAGRRYRTKEQIEEVAQYFMYKDIDYVACWYKKAAQYIQDTNIECAFVSTNSICQGEQVPALWEPLSDQYRVKINWAYDTFKWSNEARGKAAVHCVIIGFSTHDRQTKHLFSSETIGAISCATAKQINGYLFDAPNVFLKIRSQPICDAPAMRNGNVPLDGDALKIEESEYVKFTDCKYVKRLIGGRELLHGENRYVLWLVGASPSEIKKNPYVMERIEMCRVARLAMKDPGTRKLAETPMFFRDTNNPDRYIALPMVSSERRKYIPMVFLDGNTIPTNQVQIIPNATLYHFGILTSSVHNAWTRAVCGRLKSDYRYSKDIVYNNFPWP
ncbi:MAG: hypothetical protein LBB40_01940, partial [Holophagales bacterium]|nr:hypothetical protein [Holophagales bacterium]